jgi:octopine/nopaline transport system permease protein
MELAFLVDTTGRLLSGVPLLLKLWGLSVAIGAVLAIAIALLRLSGVKPLEWLAGFYVFVFRGTPLLVQIFLIYYGLSQFPEIRQSFLWVFLREPYWCAILAFILNTAAYGSEIVRGGLLGVPFGEVEAARAFGMSGLLLFRRVVFPIALRQAVPAYGNEIILMIKATSLASIITLMEVTGIAQRLISETFRAVEVFICAGAIYLAINFIISRAVAALEHRLSPHLRDVADRAQPALLSAGKI